MSSSASLLKELSPIERFLPQISNIGADKRDELARQVALLFSASAATCAERDIVAFDQLFGDLVEQVGEETRSFMSSRLAPLSNAPHGIIVRLAADKIDVARPVLVQSVVLTDDDLLLLSSATGFDHMAAIAERAGLSARVSDVLIISGDDDVRISLARNGTAQITPRGFTRLAGQARDDRRMEQVLVDRPDLPGAAVQILVKFGSSISRQAFAGAIIKPVVPPILRGREFDGCDFAAARAHVDLLSRQGMGGEALMMRFIAEEKLAEALVVLARLIGVSLDDVQSWYQSEPPEQLLIAARAYGLEGRAIFGLLGLGRWKQSNDMVTRQAAIKRYQTLTKPQAVKLLGAWRKARHLGAAGETVQ